MTTPERERIVEDLWDYVIDATDLVIDFDAHLTPANDWPHDQHQALLDKVRRFADYLESLAPTREQREQAYADACVDEARNG